MFIKDSVKWERRHDLENNDVESIWIEVSVKNAKSFLLAVYYHLPPVGQTICQRILIMFLKIHWEKVHESRQKLSS